MKKQKFIKNEKGFTLIEIIAVIIIMGILAAVAVPKFFSMQDDAVIASLNGALSEAAARFNHAFSKYILENQKAPADVTVLATAELLGANAQAATGEDIGDFNVKWTKGWAGNATIPADPNALVIEVISSDNISATAITAMKTHSTGNRTVKVISGITWG